MSIRRHAEARNSARRTALASPVPRVCTLCGHSLNVDCCHIRPVASFKDGTSPSIINALSNICYLCPSCHRAFDNHQLNVIPPSLAELEARQRGMHKPVIRKERPAGYLPRPGPATQGPAFLNRRNRPRLTSRLVFK